MIVSVLARYRATGADLPFADPRRSHGCALEGYFWRLTDERAGRTVVVLCGINRDRAGRTWAIVGLAAHPGGFVRHAIVASGGADPAGLGVWAGDGVLRADAERLHVDLGAGARLDVRLHDVPSWPRTRAYGALGLGHAVPALGQYWHPHGLDGEATGLAVLGDRPLQLNRARVYAEKNWSHRGFPDEWWWGQAHGFGDGAPADACVAFAGGTVRVGPAAVTATAAVVRAGGRVLVLGNPLLSPVRVEVGDGSWRLRARSARHLVDVEGTAGAQPHVLPIPLPAQRHTVPGSVQHLAGRMRVAVRRRGRIVFAGESVLAGLEHGGRGVAERELAGPHPLGRAA